MKLIDFGIAKFEARTTNTVTGELKGKFSYMSPEQCWADLLDRRSDIFSLGIVLFEMTTNHRLFARESELLTMKAITEIEIPSPTKFDPNYPQSLARICEKALSRKRKERYNTAADMRRDLVRFIRGTRLRRRVGRGIVQPDAPFFSRSDRGETRALA